MQHKLLCIQMKACSFAQGNEKEQMEDHALKVSANLVLRFDALIVWKALHTILSLSS